MKTETIIKDEKTANKQAYIHLNASENTLLDIDLRAALSRRASEYCTQFAIDLELKLKNARKDAEK